MDGAAASGAEVVDDDCIPATDIEKYETTMSQFISRNPEIAATDPNTKTLEELENEMKKAFKQNLIESIETQLHKARIA